MTRAYNNPYYPLPIRWIRLKEPIYYDMPTAYMDTDFWGNETVPDPPNYVWYPARLFAAKYKISSEDKIVSYDHREGYPRPITWKEYKTMFAKLEYNG